MKRCPECGRTFTNSTLAFCLNDGTALVEDTPQTPPYYGAPSPPPTAATPLPAFPVSAKISSFGVQQAVYAGVPKRAFPWRRLLSIAVVTVLLGCTWLRIHQAQWNTAPDSALRLSLTTAIKDADDAESLSVRSLSTAPLSASFTGPALERGLSRVQDLKNRGTALDQRLLSQNYTAFRVSPDRTEAQVDVAETWTTAIYSVSSRRQGSAGPAQSTPQTVYLRQADGKWIIEKIEFH